MSIQSHRQLFIFFENVILINQNKEGMSIEK
jgi:hypothetical protein